MTSFEVAKACKGYFSCSAAAVNPPALYSYHKVHTGQLCWSFMGQKLHEIFFCTSQKHICLI